MKSNTLDIFLMVVSFAIAFALPFELFLFAYAVLGPLHYLTEINWLRNRDYFTPNKNHVWILVLLTVMASVPILIPNHFNISLFERVQHLLNRAYGSILFIALVFSFGLIYTRKAYQLFILLLLALAIAFFCRNLSSYQLLMGLFLPSLIHVYVFTLLFMIYGAVKEWSNAAVISIVLLLLAPFIFLYMPFPFSDYKLTSDVLVTFLESNFQNVNIGLAAVIEKSTGQRESSFVLSDTGLRIQSFIAFAYVYHYLNWFSKVSLIGWLRSASKSQLMVIGLIWLLSVSLYYFDYRTGLAALFFLSLLHVVLEFPLNAISIRGLFSHVKNKVIAHWHHK